MRKMSLLVLGVMSVMAVSCTEVLNDGENDEGQTDEKVTLSASFEQPTTAGKSKTVLVYEDDKFKVKWVAGDEIRVWDTESQTGNAVFSANKGDEEDVEFSLKSGSIDLTKQSYYAFYPASAIKSVSGNTVEFSIPQSQRYAENSFSQDGNYAAAYGKLDATGKKRKINMQFKNVAGILRLGLGCTPGTHARIGSIVLKDNNNAKLCGTFQVTMNGANAVTAQYKAGATDGAGSITLDCSNNGSYVNLSDGTIKYFYFTVPVGAFTNGFTAEVYTDCDHLFSTIATTAGVSGVNVIERSVISKISDIQVAWLPDGYTEYKWLQSQNGDIQSQMILTGYNPVNGMRIVFKGTLCGGVNNPSMCGLVNPNEGTNWSPWISVDFHKEQIRVTSNSTPYYIEDFVKGHVFKLDASFFLGNNKYIIYVDDELKFTSTIDTTSGYGLPSGNFSLFASKIYDGQPNSGFDTSLSSTRFYYFKIYSDEAGKNIQRYFIPATSGGIKGMYDLITKDFYTNPGTSRYTQSNGEFLIGND